MTKYGLSASFPTLPTCCLVAILATGELVAGGLLPPATEIGSLGFGRVIFETDTCKITAVHIDDDVLDIEFTGRWLPSTSANLADTDKNALIISRDKSTSRISWEAFARKFSEARNKPAILHIAANGFIVRGGVLMFSYPKDEFEICLPEGKEIRRAQTAPPASAVQFAGE